MNLDKMLAVGPGGIEDFPPPPPPPPLPLPSLACSPIAIHNERKVTEEENERSGRMLTRIHENNAPGTSQQARPNQVMPASWAQAEWDSEMQWARGKTNKTNTLGTIICWMLACCGQTDVGGCCGPNFPGPDRKREKRAAVMSRLDELTGLSVGDKLFVKECYAAYEAAYDGCVYAQNKALRLDILFGITSAVVPILIPFSTTYDETQMTLFGVGVGDVLSLLAVLCSLTASITRVYQIASKVSEKCEANSREAAQIEQAINNFIGRAGAEYDIGDDKLAFKNFVLAFSTIRMAAYADFVATTTLPKAPDNKASEENV